ncbi:interleukin-18 receptor 1 [Amia ocellicauda]|uniref:interleukin-18 receptor 1 n=1 Tax=Amia ocellicauda TaxID=2972642 RepID=UPI003464040C
MFLFLVILIFKECSCECPSKHNKVFAHAGELALLRFRSDVSHLRNETLAWSVNSTLGFMELTESQNMMFEERNLILFGVTFNDTGHYQCSLRNDTGIVLLGQVDLTVYTGVCYTEKYIHRVYRSIGNSVTLYSSMKDDITFSTPKITWLKDCSQQLEESENLHIDSLEKRHAGKYTCIYTYEFGGKQYNLSQTTDLVVNENEVTLEPKIISPTDNEILEVELGKRTVIVCKAEFYAASDLLGPYWLNGSEFFNEDERVSSNDSSYESNGKHLMQSTIIYQYVTEEDLKIKHICKLDSKFRNTNVSITLKVKEMPPVHVKPIFLWSVILGIFAGTVLIVVVVYVKLKINIVLFYRDLTGKDDTAGDGKVYDAYVIYYKTSSTTQIDNEEREIILNLLESHYGYQLCLFDRDVLPGGAFADTVLEYIDKSRRLIMIPSTDCRDESQYELVTGLHNALVDRKMQIVFIEYDSATDMDLLPESLRLLVKSNGMVKWKGRKSIDYRSPFWKKLRYMMPAKKLLMSSSEEEFLLSVQQKSIAESNPSERLWTLNQVL